MKNYRLNTKQRVWIVCLVFAAVGSQFLRANAPKEYPVRILSFNVKSGSDLLDGTRGTIRAVYSDPEHKKMIGIDYCHNHWNFYPDVNAPTLDCAKTISIEDMKKGVKAISIPKIGTALEVQAPDFSPTQGGLVDIVLGYKLRMIGSNSYRKLQINITQSQAGNMIANYQGSYVGEIKLHGWANVALLKGGLDTIELTTGPDFGNRTVYKNEVENLEKP